MLTKEESLARQEIYLEQYSLRINIEAKTAISMVKTLFIPAVVEYMTELGESIQSVEAAGSSAGVQKDILVKISKLLESAYKKLAKLEAELAKAQAISHDAEKKADFYKDKICPAMKDIRVDIDTLESLVDKGLWPVPTYQDLLFSL